MPFAHNRKCQEDITGREAAIQKWVAAWPKYCRTCNGWGALCYAYDPSPAGVSLSAGTLTDCDPCQTCTENGLCPRCGGLHVYEDPDIIPACPHCGWEPKARDATLPPEPECWCWEEDDKAIWELGYDAET